MRREAQVKMTGRQRIRHEACCILLSTHTIYTTSSRTSLILAVGGNVAQAYLFKASDLGRVRLECLGRDIADRDEENSDLS